MATSIYPQCDIFEDDSVGSFQPLKLVGGSSCNYPLNPRTCTAIVDKSVGNAKLLEKTIHMSHCTNNFSSLRPNHCQYPCDVSMRPGCEAFSPVSRGCAIQTFPQLTTRQLPYAGNPICIPAAITCQICEQSNQSLLQIETGKVTSCPPSWSSASPPRRRGVQKCEPHSLTITRWTTTIPDGLQVPR